MFHQIIAHGMWGGALISTLLGTQLPGPGTIYLGRRCASGARSRLGDTITVSVTATAKDAEKQAHHLRLPLQQPERRGRDQRRRPR